MSAGVLVGEHDLADSTRRLLGRPTTCVGREREIGNLLATFDECVSEPVARVAVVTGAPGAGKSRVRAELCHELRERGAQLELLMGRGDSLSIGSPFGMLAEAIRRSAGILDGEPTDRQRDKLLDSVARHAGAGQLVEPAVSDAAG